MIAVTGISKSFGGQTLFDKVDLQLNAGCRYGVVGANGSGKSTFLRMLMGEDAPTTGEITLPKAARVGMLRQDRFLDDAVPVVHVAMAGDEAAWSALVEQDALAQQDSPDPARIGEVDEILNALDGYALEARASQILVGLGVPEESLHAPLGTLSGGYKLRVLLAQALVGRPDALFLDEPTNHLDIVSIRWLEKFLLGFSGCAVIVSHDHRFLNDVATHILDVDYGTIVSYPGNYEDFEESKVATRDRKEAEISRVEKAIADKKASLERFKAKATKARQANSRLKQMERIQIERLAPTSRRYPSFSFTQTRPSGKDVLEVRGIAKAYDERPVLTDVSLAVRRGERLAVIGANGLGKSTLLKIACGRIEPDAGRVEWGHETRVGYFAQDHRELLRHPDQSVLDCLWGCCPDEATGYVRGVLGRMLFSREEVDKKLSSLSGGEAARLVFCQLMVQRPNVLCLDEPTNHLDLESIEALADALDDYEGTLVFVSHDRWFVSKLATRVLEIRRDGLRDFPGGYDDYLEREGDDHLDDRRVRRGKRSEPPAPNPTPPPAKAPTRPATGPKGAAPTPADGAKRRVKKRRATMDA